MKKECSIVRDLLPLYAEDMVSAETGEFVREHLEGCEECRTECEGMKQAQEEGGKDANGKENVNSKEKAMVGDDVAPLVNLKKKLQKQKVKTILCTGLFLVALFVAAFACLSIPVYFSYTEDLFTIKENGDESITITFDERVTDYLLVTDAYNCPEEVMNQDVRCYQISAWYSLWSKWFSKRGAQSVTIQKGVTEEISVYYTSNDGREDVCVYGEPITSGGVITLPRLVLGYYFVLAVVCAAVLLVIWFFVRHKAKGKAVIETILLYPVSYCIAHVIIAGYRPTTYAAQRDFLFILFISILIYGGVLLARSIYRERKEIKALTGRN